MKRTITIEIDCNEETWDNGLEDVWWEFKDQLDGIAGNVEGVDIRYNVKEEE